MGVCVYCSHNNNMYEGEWHRGREHGKGVMMNAQVNSHTKLARVIRSYPCVGYFNNFQSVSIACNHSDSPSLLLDHTS